MSQNRAVDFGGTYIFHDEVVLVSALYVGVRKRLRLLTLLCFHFSFFNLLSTERVFLDFGRFEAASKNNLISIVRLRVF